MSVRKVERLECADRRLSLAIEPTHSPAPRYIGELCAQETISADSNNEISLITGIALDRGCIKTVFICAAWG
jgi:hypothetical protein